MRAPAIYALDALESPTFVQRLRRVAAAGEEPRSSRAVPVKLLLVDSEAAVLPAGEANRSGVAIVHRSPLLPALIALFDTDWQHAQRRVDALFRALGATNRYQLILRAAKAGLL